MEATSNLLGRASLPHYQPVANTVSSSIVSGSPPQDIRRSLNGWNYAGPDPASVLSHGTCNFGPYAPPLGAGPGVGHKPTYATFTSAADYLPPNCQQLQLANQLNPLNTLAAPRNVSNFPFYGDMYQPNPPGMTGTGLFSDFTSLPAIPRFDAEPAPPYMNEATPQNSGMYYVRVGARMRERARERALRARDQWSY